MATDAQSVTTAVIRTGGKQYLVAEGDTLEIEKLGDQKSVSFEPLLVTKSGKTVAGKGKVTATVVGATKGEKLIVFKMKAKKGYRRKTGHRQQLTTIKIEQITA